MLLVLRGLATAMLLPVALLVGCQRDGRAEPPVVQASALVIAPVNEPMGPVVVHGIIVKFLDGGLIALSGRDQWGNAFDTTYESLEFFRKALPVLERSITAEQVSGLRTIAVGR